MIFFKKSPQKFVVLTTQRSGSTWFISLLSSHPDIKVFGEVFLDAPVKSAPAGFDDILPKMRFFDYRNTHSTARPWATFKYINYLENCSSEHQYVGFKLMYNHLSKYREILLKLIVGRYKIIHLVRNNHLDVILSRNSLKNTQIAHQIGKVEVEQKSYYIDPSQLLSEFMQLERTVQSARRFLSFMPVDVLEISYEDLLKNVAHESKKTMDFLGLESDLLLISEMKKINKKPYGDVIENYSEVQQVLFKTKFRELLEA